jgi:hypothetical protein
MRGGHDIEKLYPLALLIWLCMVAFVGYTAMHHGKPQDQIATWACLCVSGVTVYNAFSLNRAYEWVWSVIWCLLAFAPFTGDYPQINSNAYVGILVILLLAAFASQRWWQER